MAGLEGRHALITGGASGIGREVARRLRADGVALTLVDVDAEGLQTAAEELDAGFAVADVTDEQQVERAVDTAVSSRGELHLAVNAAGSGTFGSVTQPPVEEWRRVLDLCLTAVFLCAKHEARHMPDGAAIVNISSLNARQPAAGMVAYCAAKAGVEMLTKVAALDLADRGIRVNAVAPGLVDTPLSAGLMEPPIRDEYVDNTPLGRPGSTQDIARVVRFLLSSESGWITGDTLRVDGGAHMKRYPELDRIFGAG